MKSLIPNLINPYRVGALLLLIGYVILMEFCIPNYIILFSLNMLLGILAIWSVWQGNAEGKYRFFWWLAIAALLLLYAKVPSKFILYLVIGLAMFRLLASMAGKPGILALVALILMSPLCEFFTNVFGFPIRLEITRLAASIMHMADPAYHSDGNIILKGNSEFSVDTVCMGLHMQLSSLLAGLIFIGIYQRKLGKRLSVFFLVVLLAIILGLNLISNFIRIILLVALQVPPANKQHEIIGLACFVAYVLWPSSLIINYLVKRKGYSAVLAGSSSELPLKKFKGHMLLFIVVFAGALANKDRSITNLITWGKMETPGYKIELLPDAITKLSNNKVLIYLKPIFGFYASDHQPMMCWKGSGFEFKKVETVRVNGDWIYLSSLEKGNSKLYTAWWYDNGKQHTISQLQWRWEAFRTNHPWVLVNVTAASQQELFKQIRQIQSLNPCRQMIDISGILISKNK